MRSITENPSIAGVYSIDQKEPLNYLGLHDLEPIKPVNTNYTYRGNLSETTLPEMLYSIGRFRVPGVIEAANGDVIKKVYIRQGYILHASSTDRKDSLGVYLAKTEAAPLKLLQGLSEMRQKAVKRFGVLVLERGIMSPAQVLQAIQGQLESIIWSLFYWSEGEVTFGIGELEESEMVQIQLPIPKVIVEGIKQAPDARPLLARLGEKDTILEPCFDYEDLIETGLDREEFSLLRSVDGKKSLYELCSQGPEAPGQVAKMLYAFQVLHLVRVRKPIETQRDGPVKIRLGASKKENTE